MLTLAFDHGQPAPDRPERELAVWRDEEGTIFARALTKGAFRWIEWWNLGVFAFSSGSTDVLVWPAPGVERASILDAFARALQPIILQALGRQSLHASAVLAAEGVVAFCGVGRSGKSTVAYALGRRGYRQIADDALVIERSGRGVLAYMLPFAPGLRELSRRHFGCQDETATRTPEPDVTDVKTSPRTAALRAVFLLRQDAQLGEPAPPCRIAPVHAFSALVTHARCFDEADASHTRQLVEDYLHVAEHVPVMAVGYPPAFDQFDRLIGSLTSALTDLGISPLSVDRQPATVP